MFGTAVVIAIAAAILGGTTLIILFFWMMGLRRVVLGAGGLQSLLSAAAICAAGLAFGLDLPVALLIGFALALSSTAIVMQLLVEEKRAAQPVGRAALGVLLFQDILVAPILMIAIIFRTMEAFKTFDLAYILASQPTTEVISTVSEMTL